MDIFLLLFTNLIPLYILIGLGFIAGRWLHVDRHSLGNLVIFICMPIMAFGFIVQLEFKPEYAALPFVSLGIATIVLAGTLFALVYIPAVLALLGWH